MQRNNETIDTEAAMRGTERQRRIEDSRCPRTFINEQRHNESRPGKIQQEDPKIVKPRKGDLRHAKKNRKEKIAKAGNDCRHDKEEDHEHSMASKKGNIKLLIPEKELLTDEA